MSRKQKEKAVKLGVVNPFSRLLAQYFNHWITIKDEYKETLMKKIKLQIIKVYQNKLGDAFAKMKQKGAVRKKKMKMVMNMEVESQNVQIEEQIKQEEQKIKQSEVRS